MRRSVKATVAALAVVAAVILPAMPASAVDPLPGPVVDIPELPSRAVARGAASPMQTEVLVELWRIMTGRGTPATGSVAVVAPPKTILTNPAQFARVGGTAAGSVLTAGMAGWAIGANGSLAVIGTIQGTDYESVYCAQPQWYQATTQFINMGFAPDCMSRVPEPNADQPESFTPVTYGGWHASYLGGMSTPYGPRYCYTLSGSLPAGYGAIFGGDTSVPYGSGGVAAGNCDYDNYSPRFPAGNFVHYLGPTVRVINASTGVTVAEATVTRANPTRTTQCKVTWQDGVITHGEGISFDEDSDIPISADGLGCTYAYTSRPGAGPALLPSEIEVGTTDEGGAYTEISRQEVPDFTTPQRESMVPLTTRGLVLKKVVGTTTFECNAWAVDCADWWDDTASGTTPGAYRCEFGGREVSLLECGPYRRTFDTPTTNPTITDPTTGEDVGWSAQPTTGNSINPGTGPGTGVNPADQCFSAGWASVANPIDWVLVPIKCALVWAFVPRPATVQTATTTMADAWADTMPGKLPAIVASAFVVPAGGSGCMGPHVNMPLELGGRTVTLDFYPLAACEGVPATIAAFARTIGAAIMIFMTGLGIVRRASATVNAPGVGG